MTDTAVLINRSGGAAARDPDIAKTVAAALEAAGVPARVELIDGGECEVRAKAAAERGDEGPGAFYGAYFRDPDGNKICVFTMGQ